MKHQKKEAKTVPLGPVNGNIHAENEEFATAWEDSETMSEGGVAPASTSVPSSSDPIPSEAEPVEALDAEIVDEDEENSSTTDESSPASVRRSKRSPSLTASDLYRRALGFSLADPARGQLGLYYEAQLKFECNLTILHPISRHDASEIQEALQFHRYWRCQAVDLALKAYLNDLNEETNGRS